MDFLFLGQITKQLEIFQNKENHPTKRLKAFQVLIEEVDKNKAQGKERIRSIMHKEAVTLYDVCLQSLRSFEEQPAPVKGKFDIKLCGEIDEIMGFLYRLFSDFPNEKINEISSADFIYIVSNMLRHNTADKFRIGGFFLLLKYMNILLKTGAAVPEPFEQLFEKCLSFEESVEELIPISLKSIPRLEDSPSSERWVSLISKETGEIIKAMTSSKEEKGSLNEFFDHFENIIDRHLNTAKYWFSLIKRCWLKYFYPNIYFQYEKEEGKEAATTGFHPICPPIVHRKVCKMLLQFLGNEAMLNTICDVKENLYFIFDVLSQTYWTANMKTLNSTGHFEAYEKIRKDFLLALRILISNDLYFKIGIEQETENSKYEISLKIIMCFLQVFLPEFWFLEIKPEEFKIILTIISIMLKKIETLKYSDKIYVILFNALVNASNKIGPFLDQQREKKGLFSEESQQALSYIERLINQLFEISLSPSINNDQRIWSKMREFSKMWCTNSIFILLWQKSVVDAASNLADKLGTMSDSEYKVLCDEKLLPFEGLPMKKEYSLQVLYNAHAALVSQPPEEAMTFMETSIFKEVYNTTLYKIFDLWLNILELVQFPPGVVKREILIEYIKTLHGVIDAVVPVDKSTKMREGKEHVILSSFPPPNITIFDLFSPYLFPFCQPPEGGMGELEEVRNISLRTVCSLFCGNQCEVPLALDYFAHIIRIIYMALSFGTNTTKSIVLQHTKCIFSLDYKGLLILIPTYLDQIAQVFNPSNDFSYKTKNAAITILASLLCLPDYYEKYDISIIGTSEKLPMAEVKSRVIKEVMNCLNKPVTDDTNLRYVKKGLCCATVLLFQESAKSAPNAAILRSLLEIILRKCLDINIEIQSVALSCTSAVGYLFPIFNQSDPTLIQLIFDQLAKRMSELTFEKGVEKPDKQNFLSNIIQALLELVIEDRFGVLIKNKDTFLKIMDSTIKLSKMIGMSIKDEALMLIEFIKEYYMNYPLRNQSTTVTGSMFDELEFYSLQENTLKSFHRSFLSGKRRKSNPNVLEDEKLKEPQEEKKIEKSKTQIELPSVAEEIDPGTEENSSARFYDILKKSSPMVMQYLTGSTDPIETVKTEGPRKLSLNNPRDAEYHAAWKAKTVHFAYGNEAIISIIQSPYLSSRIIIRDLIGKHAWLITEHRVLDFNCIDTIDYNDKAAVYKNLLNLKGDQKLKDLITENKGVPESSKSLEEQKSELAMKLANEISTSKEDINLEEELKKVEDTDALARVLKLFGKHCSDASIFKDLLSTWEEQEIAKNAKEISEFETKAKKVEESELALFKVAEAEHKTKNEDEFKADVKLLNRMYSSEQTRMDHARAFLCHLGDLDILPSAGTSATPLPQLLLLKGDEPDFRMMLESLDNNCGLRRSIKLGVIYVERGQFDQKSILYNTKGSTKYEEFLKELGKPVRHKDAHKSLMLQPEGLYYATATYELVFHVITLMATNFNDAQQLEKKKFVGNDLVHIVWSENDRLYKPGTITGAFNFVHIIIYPMRSGLYRILIEKKKDDKKKGKLVNFFGPLLNAMVLPMEILPSLLRLTAINARKNITIKQLQMMNVMTERRSTLEKIVSMYCCKATTKAEQQFLLVDRLLQCSSK